MTARKPSKPKSNKPKAPVVIDFHAHIVNRDVLALTLKNSQYAKSVAPRIKGKRSVTIPRPQLSRMTDPARRLRDMDAMGIDIQVISSSILQQGTEWADARTAARIERMANDLTAEAVARHPDRLVGLATVPMQSPAGAVKELDRAVTKLGLRGVQISSNVKGVEIGDKRFWPFWKKAQELDVPVFIHPAGSTEERLKKHRLLITLGQPLEEAYAMSSLVYEGVIDKFPKLKVLFAHGGGFLPFYTGRHDNNYRRRPDPKLTGDFSSYVKKFYYETVLFNPDMLEFLATKVATSHIMMGTDYPFGESKPIAFVRRAKSISLSAQDAILGRNAARILKISI